jgi:hypothetical protein
MGFSFEALTVRQRTRAATVMRERAVNRGNLRLLIGYLLGCSDRQYF